MSSMGLSFLIWKKRKKISGERVRDSPHKQTKRASLKWKAMLSLPLRDQIQEGLEVDCARGSGCDPARQRESHLQPRLSRPAWPWLPLPPLSPDRPFSLWSLTESTSSLLGKEYRSADQSVVPQGEGLVLGLPAGDMGAACVPPVGRGVLPSSLRPGLSGFQFGDLFLCQMSRIYGWGGGVSRVISHFTANS